MWWFDKNAGRNYICTPNAMVIFRVKVDERDSNQ